MPGGITLIESAASDIPTPGANKKTLFINSDTGLPSYKDDTGTVTSLVGATGATGAQGAIGPAGFGGDGLDGDDPVAILATGPAGAAGAAGAAGPPGPAMITDDYIPNEILANPASGAAGFGGWTIVKTKAVDDTVTNSATYTSDSELVITLDASGRYLFEMIIFYSGTSIAADYKFRLLFSQALAITASIMAQYNVLGLSLSPQAPSASIGNSTTVWPLDLTGAGTDASSTVLGFFCRGVLIAPAAGGTMTYQFSQSTQTVGQSCKTLIGSTIRLQKFA